MLRKQLLHDASSTDENKQTLEQQQQNLIILLWEYEIGCPDALEELEQLHPGCTKELEKEDCGFELDEMYGLAQRKSVAVPSSVVSWTTSVWEYLLQERHLLHKALIWSPLEIVRFVWDRAPQGVRDDVGAAPFRKERVHHNGGGGGGGGDREQSEDDMLLPDAPILFQLCGCDEDYEVFTFLIDATKFPLTELRRRTTGGPRTSLLHVAAHDGATKNLAFLLTRLHQQDQSATLLETAVELKEVSDDPEDLHTRTPSMYADSLDDLKALHYLGQCRLDDPCASLAQAYTKILNVFFDLVYADPLHSRGGASPMSTYRDLSRELPRLIDFLLHDVYPAFECPGRQRCSLTVTKHKASVTNWFNSGLGGANHLPETHRVSMNPTVFDDDVAASWEGVKKDDDFDPGSNIWRSPEHVLRGSPALLMLYEGYRRAEAFEWLV